MNILKKKSCDNTNTNVVLVVFWGKRGGVGWLIQHIKKTAFLKICSVIILFFKKKWVCVVGGGGAAGAMSTGGAIYDQQS